MSEHAPSVEPISYFACFWIVLSLFLGVSFYFSFVFEDQILAGAGEVWSFLRWLFSAII